MARANPLRFSTKYQDEETDLLFFGYRYYIPSLGKWTSRDPLGEIGGSDIYALLNNSPLAKVDYLGLAALDPGHLEEVKKVAEALRSKCTSRCIDRCSSCTPFNCALEALVIAEVYVQRVYEIRQDGIPNKGDRHWGWLCYEWAGLVLQPLARLNLHCWTIRWTGFVQVPPADGWLLHNFLFASVGDSKDETKGPKRDCGKVLDPWRRGRPDIWDVSDWSYYNWNFINDPFTGAQWYWNGEKWVPAYFRIPSTPQL